MRFLVSIYIGGRCPETRRHINEMTNKTKKIKNNVRAISTEMNSTPVNPNSPAMIASTRKAITKPNMRSPFLRIKRYALCIL